MHQIIMVVAADLQKIGNDVCVGPETEGVCEKAAEIARAYPHALVYATAGFSDRFGVTMGEGPMKDELLLMDIQEWRIRTPKANSFDTDGEMQALVKDVPWVEFDTVELYLVCRWWHMPRAHHILQSYLRKAHVQNVKVIKIEVESDVALIGFIWEAGAWSKRFLRFLRSAL